MRRRWLRSERGVQLTHSARSFPMLSSDDATIRIMVGGETEAGLLYDDVIEIRPGDPGYDELLPEARLHPFPLPRADAAPVDPGAIARLVARHDRG